jgi:regulator of sirC expression with transglutaminase-like and TPR domain
MQIHVPLCAVLALGTCFVSGHDAAAEGPSLDCSRAAAYAFLKSTRGRAYADQVGIPFWRLRQACQYDPGCIRQVQIQAINAYQAAGAPISVPQRTTMGAFEATTPRSDSSAELRLCRNSTAAADKIAHCSNVIADFNNVSALVVAHNTRGLALMEVGRFSDAVDDFTFVIKREPQIAGFYDNRQNAFRRSGRLDDALRDANEAIRLAPTYSFVFRGRANVYNDMGQYDLAVSDYDHAIQLAPDDGGLFIDRGKVLRTQSKFDQSISDFTHALDLDRKWTAAYRERGLTYKQMGQSPQAIDDLTIYDRLQPGDQVVALALTELGNRQPPLGSDNAPSVSVPAKQPPSERASVILGQTVVPMVPEGGTFLVPVRINDQITLNFVIDSGASDVSVPADVVMTLLRAGTITNSDFLGTQEYRMANGKTVPSQQFVIRSLKVGDRTLENVTGSVAPVEGALLLG